MSYIGGILIFGVLFAVFGVLAKSRWRGNRCTTCGSSDGPGGCAACSTDLEETWKT